MFIWIKISILLVSICLSAINEDSKYNLDYSSAQNLLVVEGDFTSNTLKEELNTRFHIGIEDLIDIGLAPFSTLYMIDLDNTYSLEYSITSSYSLYDVNIELDNDLVDNTFMISDPISMRSVNLIQINYFDIVS